MLQYLCVWAVLCCAVPAGRLDFVKHWLLHWEGLLIGGVFVGGLGMTAAKLYVNERMDDIAR